MTRQPGPSGRGRSGRPSTAEAPGSGSAGRTGRRAGRAPRRDGDRPIRRDRVEQLDLDADDRVDAGASAAVVNRTEP
jgi:hypothetical protein